MVRDLDARSVIFGNASMKAMEMKGCVDERNHLLEATD